MSGLDLIWTLLAGQSGQMRELNPIGRNLIAHPVGLVAFKIIATVIGCVLLYVFRRDRRVAQAAWWLCLTLTVLTFRWLVFNSMHFGA